MNKDLIKAKKLLSEGGYTCVLCKDEVIHKSSERGIKPLVEWYDSGLIFEGYSAADKVVGKAAAMMYVLLKVKEVFSFVMSKGAIETLETFGVKWYCDVVAEGIINRAGTGSCPMEQAVFGHKDPLASYKAIKEKLLELKEPQSNK